MTSTRNFASVSATYVPMYRRSRPKAIVEYGRVVEGEVISKEKARARTSNDGWDKTLVRMLSGSTTVEVSLVFSEGFSKPEKR